MNVMIFQLGEITDLLSTLLFWFAIIVIVALIMGAVIMFLRIYFFTSILAGVGPRRTPEVGKECPNCRGYSPKDSKFCKNCGQKF